MMFDALAKVLPRITRKIQFLGLLVIVAAVVARANVMPAQIHVVIAAGTMGVLFLVFGQLFSAGALNSIPKEKRASLLVTLFVAFLSSTLILIVVTGYFLTHPSPTQTGSNADARSQNSAPPPDIRSAVPITPPVKNTSGQQPKPKRPITPASRPEYDKPAQTGIGVRAAGEDALVDGSLVVGDNVGISDTGTRTTIRNSVVVGSKSPQTVGSKTTQTQIGLQSAGDGAVIDHNLVTSSGGPAIVDVGRGTTFSNNTVFSIDFIVANLPDSLRTLRDVCEDGMKGLPEDEVRQRRNKVKTLEELILANSGTDLVKPKVEEILRVCTAR